MGLQEFTSQQFKIIDEDNSGTIEHDEFEDWISTTKEIQDFLCMYTGVQTHKYASWRFETEKSMWRDFFHEISVNYCGKRFVEMKLLVTEMDKKLKHIDENIRTKLYYLFDYEGDSIINEPQFMSLMTIWSAFSANDINNDNELDSHEVKQLFWLFDGKKPTKDKIARETEIMDEDNSGTIDRLEWMAYLCSSSSNSDGFGSKDYYDFELREAFEAADEDKDGQMTQAEFIALLRQKCEQQIKNIDESERWKLDTDFKQCAIEMWVLLTGDKPANKTDGMTWVQMKHFNQKCSERLESL